MPNPRKLTLAVLLSLASIASLPAQAAEPSKSDTAKSKPAPAPQTELTGAFVYKYLIGEVAGQRGDLELASTIFLDLAKSSRDPRLAERAAKAAVYGNKPRLVTQAVSLWSELDPSSTEAQQASTELFVNAGKLNDAKPFLQKLLAKEDTRANGFLYLNSLLAKQTDKNAVLSLVQELAAPYPDLPEAHFTIANSALAAGKVELAMSELDIAEKLSPGWEMSALLKGQILYLQSPDAAINFYKQFLSANENANEVRLTMARLLINQKRFDEAKPEFIKLISASKNNPEIMVVVGLLSIQANELADAEKYFQDALAAGFKNPDQVFIYLGQIAEKQNDDKLALAWYNRVKPGDRYLDAQFNIAGIVARTQGIDAALQVLRNIPELTNEQEALSLQMQASLLGKMKRYQEAYDLLGQTVATLPNTPEIIYDYAMAAERIGQFDIAEKELRKLIKLKPDFAQAYNALGYSLADRNLKLDEAHKLIQQALALSPDDHYILDSMGWVQYRMGKLDSASNYLRQAYSQQPDPEIAAHLGEVLWHQGKKDEAVQTWESALRAFPDNEVLIKTAQKFKN
jgi:tetratricopeptide (TPR) repeat protein